MQFSYLWFWCLFGCAACVNVNARILYFMMCSNLLPTTSTETQAPNIIIIYVTRWKCLWMHQNYILDVCFIHCSYSHRNDIYVPLKTIKWHGIKGCRIALDQLFCQSFDIHLACLYAPFKQMNTFATNSNWNQKMDVNKCCHTELAVCVASSMRFLS